MSFKNIENFNKEASPATFDKNFAKKKKIVLQLFHFSEKFYKKKKFAEKKLCTPFTSAILFFFRKKLKTHFCFIYLNSILFFKKKKLYTSYIRKKSYTLIIITSYHIHLNKKKILRFFFEHD